MGDDLFQRARPGAEKIAPRPPEGLVTSRTVAGWFRAFCHHFLAELLARLLLATGASSDPLEWPRSSKLDLRSSFP